MHALWSSLIKLAQTKRDSELYAGVPVDTILYLTRKDCFFLI